MKKDQDLENKSILELKSFKYSLIITAISTIIASGIIIYSNNLYDLCIDITCMKEFPIYFGIPFKIISAGVALAGFIAIIHRSEQTKSQIQLVLKQNTFRNFIDHRSEFYKVVSEVENEYEYVKVKNKPLFYKELFPKNTPDNVDIIAQYINPHLAKNVEMASETMSISGIEGFKFGKGNKVIIIEDEDEDELDFNFYYEDVSLDKARLGMLYQSFLNRYNENDEKYETLLIQWIGSLIFCAAQLNIHSTKNINMPKKWADYLNNESPWVLNFKYIPSDIINFAEAYHQQHLNIQSFCFPQHNQYLNEGYLPQPKDKDLNSIVKDSIEKYKE